MEGFGGRVTVTLKKILNGRWFLEITINGGHACSKTNVVCEFFFGRSKLH